MNLRLDKSLPALPIQLFWIALAACLAPWLWVRVQQGTHSDLLWLTEALSRLMAGGTMVQDAYELNPPLGFLVYIVPVAVSRISDIPLHYALFAYSGLLTLASVMAVWVIVRRWKFLTPFDVFALVAGYALASTVATSLMFGERDHYVSLALTPFVLLQVALTFGLPYPRKLTWPVFMIGALFILLKPHHGLLPTLLLVHRMVHQKRWFVLRDPDFQALAIMTTGYLAVIWFFFHDYLTVIYPDVIRLYLPLREGSHIALRTLFLLYIGIVGSLLAMILPVERAKKNLILFLMFSGTVSLIPVYVQGMGLTYHFIPPVSFYAAAFFLTALNGFRPYVRREDIALCLAMALMTGLTYQMKPLNFGFPRHGDYAHLPLTRLIKDECKGDPSCSFFMFNMNMGIIHESSYYSGVKSSSRFPSFWFLPTLVQDERAVGKGMKPRISLEKQARLREKYSDMVAEDLDRHKPKILIIWSDGKVGEEKFDFEAYFGRSGKFLEQWRNYRKSGQIELESSDYYRDSEFDYKLTIKYDIYRRIDE